MKPKKQGFSIKEFYYNKIPEKEFKAEDIASNEIDDSYESTAETSEEDTSGYKSNEESCSESDS